MIDIVCGMGGHSTLDTIKMSLDIIQRDQNVKASTRLSSDGLYALYHHQHLNMSSTPTLPPSPYRYTIQPQAYALPLIHAAKYPSSTLNGLLLGKLTPASALDSSSGHVVVSSAIPLLHAYTSLSPMMEIGLEMAEAYAAEQGLRVVGYYQANEGEDGTLGRVGERICETLRSNFDGAFGLLVCPAAGRIVATNS
jgi:hypothetical protein